jgi:hypothetical protein
LDLNGSAIVFLFFSFQETARLRMKRWCISAVATLATGPSSALPSFLYVRAGTLAAET